MKKMLNMMLTSFILSTTLTLSAYGHEDHRHHHHHGRGEVEVLTPFPLVEPIVPGVIIGQPPAIYPYPQPPVVYAAPIAPGIIVEPEVIVRGHRR